MKMINPETLADGAAYGTSQAMLDEATGLLFVAGQVDWDANSQISSDTVSGQLISAIRNLSTVLNEAGSSLKRVRQIRLYVRGEVEDHIKAIKDVLTQAFERNWPAVTIVGVSSLVSRDLLIEVEAVAHR